MRYIGSKTSTLTQLANLITARVNQGTFGDCFGGIGTVGSHFKSLGFKVSTCDVLRFAHFFQIARVQRQSSLRLRKVREATNSAATADLLVKLNSRSARTGWFMEEYSVKRRFFTLSNAKRIQSCWNTINEWHSNRLSSAVEHAVLTASLINSMDKVANTAGTYYTYLKDWHRKARQNFEFQLLLPTKGSVGCRCLHLPADEYIRTQNFDVLYLDPPYNERSYVHYYHLPETLALGSPRSVKGVGGTPTAKLERSVFNDPKRASSSLKLIVATAKFKLLAFHYSDEGIISPDEVRAILSSRGVIEEFELTSRGYTTAKIQRKIKHRLYLVNNA